MLIVNLKWSVNDSFYANMKLAVLKIWRSQLNIFMRYQSHVLNLSTHKKKFTIFLNLQPQFIYYAFVINCSKHLVAMIISRRHWSGRQLSISVQTLNNIISVT